MAAHRNFAESDSTSSANPADAAVTTIAGIYGSNASGKSNILNAIDLLSDMVRESYSQWLPDSDLPFEPFALDPTCATAPTSLEVEVLIDDIRYQYGFEYDQNRVRKEYIYAYPHGRRQTWLERSQDNENNTSWYFGKSLAGRNKVIQDLTRENCLFLSAAASAMHRQLGKIYQRLSYNIRIASPDNFDGRLRFTLGEIVRRPEALDQIRTMLKAADLGVRDLKVASRKFTTKDLEAIQGIVRAIQGATTSEPVESEIPGEMLEEASRSIQLLHMVEEGQEAVALPFEAESLGTRALIALTGPVLQALRRGDTLLVDEIDSSLHPRLVAGLIALFSSEKTNPNKAQLIFSSHDTSLLGTLLSDSGPILERDQIWFVQKDRRGSSTIYALTDFKARRLENWERGYLQGRYGAIPYIALEAIESLGRKGVQVTRNPPADGET